jgi:hypothetical protein
VSPQPFGTVPHSVLRSAHVLQPGTPPSVDDPPCPLPPLPPLAPVCPAPADPTVIEVIVPPLPASGDACVNSLPEHAAAATTKQKIATKQARIHPISTHPSRLKIITHPPIQRGQRFFALSCEGLLGEPTSVQMTSAQIESGMFQRGEIRFLGAPTGHLGIGRLN